MSGTTAAMAGFADAAATLNAARDAWQADLSRLNAAVRAGTATGADVDAIMARDAEINAGVELWNAPAQRTVYDD